MYACKHMKYACMRTLEICMHACVHVFRICMHTFEICMQAIEICMDVCMHNMHACIHLHACMHHAGFGSAGSGGMDCSLYIASTLVKQNWKRKQNETAACTSSGVGVYVIACNSIHTFGVFKRCSSSVPCLLFSFSSIQQTVSTYTGDKAEKF